MTTTFAVFAGKRAPNYSTNPTQDVLVLTKDDAPDVCATCDARVVLQAAQGGLGRWVHANPAVPNHTFMQAKSRCRFCYAVGTVTNTQHAWHNAADCSRCGGCDGYGIGD
jgi:hypothetical protein